MTARGNQRHKLTAINTTTKTASCSICGAVKVRFKYSNRQFINRAYCINSLKQQKRNEKYDLKPENFNKLLNSQDKKCAICKVSITNNSHLDHCHETKIIRGILCQNCNWGLGQFKDSIPILESAIEYLKNNKPSR